MENTQVNYIHTPDLRNMNWSWVKDKIMKQKGTEELVIALCSNDIFPCRKEKLHYHFDSRFPCDRDEYVGRMTDLIDLHCKKCCFNIFFYAHKSA